MKIKEVLQESIEQLKKTQIQEPVLKAKMLLAYGLGEKKEYLISHDEQEVEQQVQKNMQSWIQELIQGKPIQYILHEQEFMGLPFYVDENVLIPRADTEILVEEVIKFCEDKEKIEILDMCTGSGAIGISLAKYLKKAQITQADISKEALKVAKKNVIKNKVEENITFIQTDLFTDVEGKFDVIASNPPYIRSEVVEQLEEQVKNEPRIALDGGKDGLDYYRILIKQAPLFLKSNGYLVLEIGYDQKKEVETLLRQEGVYEEISCKQDLARRDRVMIAKVR